MALKFIKEIDKSTIAMPPFSSIKPKFHYWSCAVGYFIANRFLNWWIPFERIVFFMEAPVFLLSTGIISSYPSFYTNLYSLFYWYLYLARYAFSIHFSSLLLAKSCVFIAIKSLFIIWSFNDIIYFKRLS